MRNLRRELYKKQKVVIYGLLTLCLLFGNYRLFFRPTVGSLIKTVPKAIDLQRKLNFARSAVANIPKYKQQTKELNRKLSSYKKKFSTQQEISSLLKELSDMARSAGVKIVALKPHPAVVASKKKDSNSAYKKFPISIQAACGYHQLGTFLNKLENAGIFMRVTDIKMTGNSRNPREHLVQILVNTYIITGTL